VLVLAGARLMNYRRLVSLLRGGVPLIPGLLLLASMAFGLLVFHPACGRAVGGQARWLRFGPPEYGIGFQPSELIKVSLVIFLAVWLSRGATDVGSFWRTVLPAVVLIGLCVGLVVTQDFGAAAVIALVAAVTLLFAGVRWYYLAGLLAAGGAGFYALLARSPHRLARFAAMADPWSLTNPASYQPRQSLLAILTGGTMGKGLGRGVIKQGFLPEGSTDFIFSVYCEECGVMGAVLLIGLVLVWIWLARRAAVRAPDRLGRLLAGSLGFLIAVQAVLHIAVDVVAAPPTGMGLPFVSAGGTALVTSALAVGLIVSVAAGSGGRPEAASPPPWSGAA
jgi:cell division protein FtsW